VLELINITHMMNPCHESGPGSSPGRRTILLLASVSSYSEAATQLSYVTCQLTLTMEKRKAMETVVLLILAFAGVVIFYLYSLQFLLV
jgi:hypothetical protein